MSQKALKKLIVRVLKEIDDFQNLRNIPHNGISQFRVMLEGLLYSE